MTHLTSIAPNEVEDSCVNAWNKISKNPRPHIWGTRELAVKDYQVPVRFLSDDTRCAFDVNVIRDYKKAPGDVANPLSVSNKAMALMERCAKPEGVGGTVNDFSMSFSIFTTSRSHSAGAQPGIKFMRSEGWQAHKTVAPLDNLQITLSTWSQGRGIICKSGSRVKIPSVESCRRAVEQLPDPQDHDAYAVWTRAPNTQYTLPQSWIDG